MYGFSILVEECQSHVPFSEACRGVALVFQHLGQGEASLFDQAGPSGAGEDASFAGAESHATGEQTVSSGGANRRRTMGIRKTHAFFCQFVQVRGGDLRFRIVAAKVTVAQVVSENKYNIRF